MSEHPRAAEFTVEQLLALAAQGAAHSEYWLKKACDLAGDASLLGSQISALKDDAKRLEATIRRRAA
jgi:hypothetical protein